MVRRISESNIINIPGVSDWILDNYPDKTIPEDKWDREKQCVSGSAWHHLYAEIRDLEYVMCWDDYTKAREAYDEFVKQAKSSNERERIRMLYK